MAYNTVGGPVPVIDQVRQMCIARLELLEGSLMDNERDHEQLAVTRRALAAERDRLASVLNAIDREADDASSDEGEEIQALVRQKLAHDERRQPFTPMTTQMGPAAPGIVFRGGGATSWGESSWG